MAGDSRYALGQRSRGRWLRPGMLAALSFGLVAQAAQTTFELWRLARKTQSAPVPGRAPHRPDSGLALQTVVNAHLFGEAAEAPAATPREAPAHWVLTGTLQGGTPQSGAAILGSSATTTRFCAAGQEVAGGFRLIEVFPDRVTLERAGERLSLALPHALNAPLMSAAVQLADAAPVRARPSLEERIRERPQNQTPALLELRPSLHRSVGRFDGMRVLGAGDGSNLMPYGLRRNDIIRTVDGQPINTIDAQYRALDTLSRGHPVDVTVQRNGNVFTLQLGFNDSGS